MGKEKKILTMVLVFVCVLVAGCGKDEAPKEAEGQTAKKEETYETVGNESEDALQVLMTNQTELEIAGISVKSSQEAEYPANMLRSGQTISPNEKVMFYYKAEPGKEEAAAGASPQSENDSVLSGAVINVGYSMQVTCADGTILEATLFPIEDMAEATLCYENDVFYFTYKSKTDESQVSTKEAETVAANHKRMAISVAEQILQLGDVTLESGEAIQAARAAYDALPEEAKPQVLNIQELMVKEYQFEELKQLAQWEAEQQRVAEEQAAAQRAAEERAAEQAARQAQESNGGYQEEEVNQRTDGCLGDDVLIND